ncbi:MAG: hypothetical protein XD97_0371, partial [Pelotomaculum thermopropionicum]
MMVKRISYVVLIIAFTGLGLYFGLYLLESGLVTFPAELTQQLKWG